MSSPSLGRQVGQGSLRKIVSFSNDRGSENLVDLLSRLDEHDEIDDLVDQGHMYPIRGDGFTASTASPLNQQVHLRPLWHLKSLPAFAWGRK